ncbi:MAG: hypothetical protein AAFY56_11560 [Pseudomonadota bacterium]
MSMAPRAFDVLADLKRLALQEKQRQLSATEDRRLKAMSDLARKETQQTEEFRIALINPVALPGLARYIGAARDEREKCEARLRELVKECDHQRHAIVAEFQGMKRFQILSDRAKAKGEAKQLQTETTELRELVLIRHCRPQNF